MTTRHPYREQPIVLGDKVRDTITGFEGIATGRTEWLTGCVRWIVEPDKLDKDKKVQQYMEFDESRLVVLRKQPIPQLNQRAPQIAEQPGGPMPSPTRPRTPTRGRR